jgi:hypothetical protein
MSTTTTQPAAEAAQLPAEAPAPAYHPGYQSLMLVGLLGETHGLQDDCELVAKAVEGTLSDPTAFRIHRAFAQSLGGHADRGIETLKAHLDAAPQDDRTKVVLAVSMMLAGNAEWQPLIENVLASSDDSVARESATNVVALLLSMKQ